jgi:hypothetical protein
VNCCGSLLRRFRGFGIHIRKSKNKRARKVPLEAEAIGAISELNRRHSYVFSNKDGSRPHEDIFIKPLRTAAKRASIKKRIDLHTMRHSYGSNKIRMGWGLKKVSMLLGHTDISITSDIYTHLLDGDLRVSDDFRFDKERATENSGGAVNAREMTAVKAIADALVRALKGPGAGAQGGAAMERVERELSAIIARAAAGAVISRDSTGSDEFSPDSEETLEQGFRATPLLRNEFGSVIENEMLGVDAGNFQPENDEKPNKKGDVAFATSPEIFGRGDRIRTCDLFVPNEAR